MSCTDPGRDERDERPAAVEREVDLPVPPGEVWEALPGTLGDEVELVAEPGGRLRVRGPDGERVGVVEEVDAPARLSFWWVPGAGDDAPSRVELDLEVIPIGTRLRVRETRFDAASAVRALTGDARALARA